MDCGLPGSSVQGILQARILEWVAIPFSRDLSIVVFGCPLKRRTEVKYFYSKNQSSLTKEQRQFSEAGIVFSMSDAGTTGCPRAKKKMNLVSELTPFTKNNS